MIYATLHRSNNTKSTENLGVNSSAPEGWAFLAQLLTPVDEFNFPIVNFPFICSNIPAAPAYGVYSSQFIRYSRACGSYPDFLDKRLLLKTGGEFKCSGRVGFSCSTIDTRRVGLVPNPVISHEWGKDREMFTTSEPYPWSSVTQIFRNSQQGHGGRKTFEVMISTMEYIVLSSYDIPELVVPIRISLIKGCC
jgi:hypothetical protein